MFNFENVSAERKRFVGYDINHDVTIVSVEDGVSQLGKKFIQINVKLTGDEDDNSTILKMYMSEKAEKITMSKLMTIHSAVRKVDTLKDKKFKTLEEMSKGLNELWKGRRLRLKLQAEEWMGEDDAGNPKVRIRTSIPMRQFAEAIDSGAEMPPIADADTKLVFNKSNKWDYKRLREDTNSTDEVIKGKDKKNDLPF